MITDEKMQAVLTTFDEAQLRELCKQFFATFRSQAETLFLLSADLKQYMNGLGAIGERRGAEIEANFQRLNDTIDRLLSGGNTPQTMQ